MAAIRLAALFCSVTACISVPFAATCSRTAAMAAVIISVKVVSCIFLVPLILFGEPDGDFRGHAHFLVPAASPTPLRSAKVLCGEFSSGTRLYPRGLSGAILGTGMSGAACTLAPCEAVNRRLWSTALG